MMTNTNEIGFDGAPRFRTEVRVCTAFHGVTCCGAEFTVTVDRHSLDSGYRTCERCRALPSTGFYVEGLDRYGRGVRILDGQRLRLGALVSYATEYTTIRRWIERAKANGCTNIRIVFTRHTAELGTARRRVRVG